MELRQWLGLSQAEMASALNVSRSLYSMAELGERQLDPDSVILVLALHTHMQQAPENDVIKGIEKEVQASLLSEVENEVSFQALRRSVFAKTAKYKESFPERMLVLPVPGLADTQNEVTRHALDLISHQVSRRLFRYSQVYAKDLLEELELVRCRAGAEFLRNKLDGNP